MITLTLGFVLIYYYYYSLLLEVLAKLEKKEIMFMK